MIEKVPRVSSFGLPPTTTQIRAITRLCVQLGISEALEETPRNRMEARNLIYRLRIQRREQNGR